MLPIRPPESRTPRFARPPEIARSQRRKERAKAGERSANRPAGTGVSATTLCLFASLVAPLRLCDLRLVASGLQPITHCMPDAGTEIWTVGRLLEWTGAFFARRNVDSPRLAAELLLAHVLRMPRIQLYVHHGRALAPAELAAFRDLVRRAGEHEPVQYLTGVAHFFGLELVVTRDVLIPRPDTETLVEAVLRHLKLASDTGTEQTLRIADLCTGSGAIALALASRLKSARVIATDLSEPTAAVARDNARRLGLAEQVDVRTGDLFEPLGGEAPFHVITANPPYI